MMMAHVESACESRASCAKAADLAGAESATHPPDPASAEPAAQAPGATAAEATAHVPDVAPAEPAPHVAPAKPSAMASAEAAAPPGLCAGYGQRPGERYAGHNHHQTFQHGILLLQAATLPQGDQAVCGLAVGVSASCRGVAASVRMEPSFGVRLRVAEVLTNDVMRMICLLHAVVRGIHE
jgi:hypothetical protein